MIDEERTGAIYGKLKVITQREVSGLSLLEGIYPASTRVPSHAHDQAIFCIALAGAFKETYGAKTRRYDALTAEFLPLNHDHSLFFTQDTRVFNLRLPAERLRVAHEYSLTLDQCVSGKGLLSMMLMRLYREFRMTDAASRLTIEGLALEMVAEVSRSNQIERRRTAAPWMARVIDLIHDRFRESVNLDQIATAVEVHPVHLAREFRRLKQSTIGEYIRQLRIEEACRNLTLSEKSLSSIAADAGFYDQSHFCRVFKRATGMTPVEFRATFSRTRVSKKFRS